MQIGYYYHYPIPFTAILASLCGLILVFLTIKVIKLRHKYKAPVGEIKKDEYLRKNGALSNFTANTPIVLILYGLAELGRVNCGILFFLGGLYLLARTIHIYSLYIFEIKQKSFRLRVFGMATTFFVIIALAVINMYIAFRYI